MQTGLALSFFEVIEGILEKEVVVPEDILKTLEGETETTSGWKRKKEKLRGIRAAPCVLRRLVENRN